MSSNNNERFPTHDFIIVWGIFAAVFIVVPFLPATIKALIDRIALCIGSETSTNRQEEQLDSDGRPIYSAWDLEYSRLSVRAKHQINTIRNEEISKRLDAFSTELKADHLVCRKPSQYFGNSKDVDESDDKQEKYDTSKDNKYIHEGATNEVEPFSLNEREKDDDDVEKQLLGATSDNDAEECTEAFTEPSVSTEENSTEANFTHICIPVPGYDKYGLRKLEKKSFNNIDTRKRCRKGLLALFRHGRKDVNERAKEILSGLDEHDDVEQNNEKREVPKFCAICLDEYEPSDKVCWSSNPECTHVFHHDCMVQWQMTLGKRACKHQRFSEDPSVAQVLNFATECPCCRQSFIDKAVDVEVVDGDDSNV